MLAGTVQLTRGYLDIGRIGNTLPCTYRQLEFESTSTRWLAHHSNRPFLVASRGGSAEGSICLRETFYIYRIVFEIMLWCWGYLRPASVPVIGSIGLVGP